MTQTSSLALDALEQTLHAALMHTGSVFNDPSSAEPQRLTRTTAQMKTTMSVVHSRFHAALDELEADLIRAKVILRQDLDASRAVRKRIIHPIPSPAVDKDIEMANTATEPSGEMSTAPVNEVTAHDSTENDPKEPGEEVTVNDSKEAQIQPDEQNEAEGDAGLLPGLEMYANGASVDGLDEIEGLDDYKTDQAGLGEFDMMESFSNDFGDNDTNLDDLFNLNDFVNDVDGETTGLNDPIDESFFNLDGA